MTAEKTSKPAITQHQSTGGTFFRKADGEGIFGASETPSFFGSTTIQPKLSVSQPDDPQEKEADQVADQVMRSPESTTPLPADEKKEEKVSAKQDTPLISRQAATGEELQTKSMLQIQRQAGGEEENKIMPKTSGNHSMPTYLMRPGHSPPALIQRQGRDPPQAGSSFEATLNATKGAGNVMPAVARTFMERRFGADFSEVRIHTGADAIALNRAINAQAFTQGSDIYFNSGQFAPESSTGKSLLAHELTHTIQQGAIAVQQPAAVSPPARGSPSDALSKKDRPVTGSGRNGIVQRSSPDIDLSGLSGGAALSEEARNYFQNYYKVNLNDIRIHTDSEATGICLMAGSQAFTQGIHICMIPSAYQPDSEDGAILLSKNVALSLKQRGLGNNDVNTDMGSLLQQITAAIKEQRTPATVENKPKPLAPKPGTKPIRAGEKKQVGGRKDARAGKKGKNKGDTDDGIAEAPAKKGAKKKSPSKPSEDPAFQKVVKNTKKTAKDQKQHEPAETKSSDAQKNAIAVPKEAESKAQNRKTDGMGEAAKEDKPFDAASFKADLLKKIESVTPKNLEEATEFKENNKIGGVKNAMGAKVSSEKETTTGPVNQATTQPLQVSDADNKQPVPLPATDKGAKPAGVGAKDAAPKNKLDGEISMQEQSQSLDEEMKANNVTESQLVSSKEPSFAEALDAKKGAQKDALEKPKEYRKEEALSLKEAKTTAQESSTLALNGMYGARGKNFDATIKHQKTAKEKDEEKRATVAKTIEDKYKLAESKVTQALTDADTEANSIFDTGSETARVEFENYVEEKMQAYKEDRYSGFWGGLRWAKDKLFGMPDEVNEFYTDGRKLYLDKMDEVITQVANTVTLKLNEAKQAITDGKKDIDEYVKALPKDLQNVGKEAASEIQDKFDSLEQTVNDKRNDLIDGLAKKYVDNVKKLDDRIGELKEANKGLIDKAIGFLKKVWQVIKDLVNLFTTILARLASIIGVILDSPSGFFDNLGKAFTLGFNNFKDKFLDYLEKGLMDWLATNLGIAGIELPEKFTPASILALVLQVMGITKDHIKERAIKILGPEKVTVLETAGGILHRVYNEGLGALWDMIKEKLEDLKEIVWEAIKSFIKTKIIEAAITFLLSLLSPIGAFVKLCMAIYDFLMMLVRFKDRIMDLLDTILNAVVDIAAGKIEGAANSIEKAFAKSIPVIIGFLAALLHLNDIAAKVRNIIMKIRARIDKALDFIITKAYGLVAKGVDFVLTAKAKGTALVEKGKEKVIAGGKKVISKLLEWWKETRGYKDAQGKEHLLYFEGTGADARLIRKSIPEHMDAYLKGVEAKVVAVDAADPQKPVYNAAITGARSEYDLLKKDMTYTSAAGKEEERAMSGTLGKVIADRLGKIANSLAKLPEDFSKPEKGGKEVPESRISWTGTHSVKLPNNATSIDGVKVVADPLTLKSGGPSGSVPSYYSALWKALNNQGRNVIAGHLLNHNLFGTGADAKNLVPIPGSVNTKMGAGIEEQAKKKVLQENKVVNYEVEAVWNNTPPSVVPAGQLQEEFLVPSQIKTKLVEKTFNEDLFKGKPVDDINKAKQDHRNWNDSGSALSPVYDIKEFTVSAAGSTAIERLQLLSQALDKELKKDANILWSDFASQYVEPLRGKMNDDEFKRVKSAIEAEFRSKQKGVSSQDFDQRYFNKLMQDIRVEVEKLSPSSTDEEIKKVRESLYQFKAAIDGSKADNKITPDEHKTLFIERSNLLNRIVAIKGGAAPAPLGNTDFDVMVKDLQTLEALVNDPAQEPKVLADLLKAENDIPAKTLTTEQKITLQDRIKRIRRRVNPEQSRFQRWVTEIHAFEATLKAKGQQNTMMSWQQFYNLHWVELGDIDTNARAGLMKVFPTYIKP